MSQSTDDLEVSARRQPAAEGACLFCLEAVPHCSAAVDASRTQALVITRDDAGFAHVAVPLALGGHPVGTLLAGQILDQYPESLSLQRVARSFGLSQQRVWHLACQQAPLGRTHLIVYGDLLHSLSQSFLRNRYSVIQERKSSADIKVLNTQLRRSVAEKEILLKEVHHRVKNNLQVISSLLNMQENSLNDESAVTALRDSRARVLSMALIHEQLYSKEQWDAIDFEEYSKTLVAELFYSFGKLADLVVTRFKTARILLNVDQAIPCGLILSELITNALKYAYPGGVGGEVIIELSEKQPGTVTLGVSDHGPGMPENFDIENPKSMGLEMVNILALQLGGVVTVQSNLGTHITIEFPRETKEKSFAISSS